MTVLLLAAALALTPKLAQIDTTYLYKTVLVRAAPGSLLQVIDLYRARATADDAAGDHRPFIARHSQGDQWDLMLIYPLGSFSAYYSPDREAARRRSEQATIDRRLAQHIAWREDTFMKGPPLETLRAAMAGGAFRHVEMFVAVPGKRDELLRQREMENDFYRYLDRPLNLIFVRAAGGAWDTMTIGVYRDILHFASAGDIPEEREDEAAKRAGFEAASRIGTYLRSLIQYHHDTLARAVP